MSKLKRDASRCFASVAVSGFSVSILRLGPLLLVFGFIHNVYAFGGHVAVGELQLQTKVFAKGVWLKLNIINIFIYFGAVL